MSFGDPCPNDQKFRWLVAELEIPATIGNDSTAGKVVGLQINCGDGGEVYVNDVLQSRYDNDHPALVILSREAAAGEKVRVAIQVYAHVQGGDKFDQANWVIIEAKRAKEPLILTVDPQQTTGKVCRWHCRPQPRRRHVRLRRRDGAESSKRAGSDGSGWTTSSPAS